MLSEYFIDAIHDLNSILESCSSLTDEEKKKIEKEKEALWKSALASPDIEVEMSREFSQRNGYFRDTR